MSLRGLPLPCSSGQSGKTWRAETKERDFIHRYFRLNKYRIRLMDVDSLMAQIFPPCLMRPITGLASGFEACNFIKYFLWLNIFRDKTHTSSDEVTSLRLTLIEIVKVIFYLQFRFSSLLNIVARTFAWGCRQNPHNYEPRHEVKGDLWN